jgi:hypothetical protein
MQTASTGQATSTRQPQRIEREYTSSRAFRKEAGELYARSGYTISQTIGIRNRRYMMLPSFLMSFLLFVWPRREHLIITYQPPFTPRPQNAGVR